MKRTLKISAVLTALFTATMAMAQVAPASFPHNSPSGAPHHDTDTKNTTRAEVIARVGQRFDALDANKDGVLNQVEKRAARDERKHKMRDKHQRHRDAKLERNAGGRVDHRGPKTRGASPHPMHGETGHDHTLHHGQAPHGTAHSEPKGPPPHARAVGHPSRSDGPPPGHKAR